MKTREFKQVDVFGVSAYLGNPLAVVLDGSDLSDQEMQHFASWTNLSETTFLQPPSEAGAAAGADYRVRIFTPGAELPFAGHPTLGSCHAWLEAGGKPKAQEVIVQECAFGLVKICRDDARLRFAAPALQRRPVEATLLAEIASALGVNAARIRAAQLLDNGPVWLTLLLDSRQTVWQLSPDHLALKNLGYKVGVAAIESAAPTAVLIARSNREARASSTRSVSFAATQDLPAVEVRAFAASVGVNEDPVTGSLNASLAQWLIAEGLAPAVYIAEQGHCLGRAGRVHIEQDEHGQVWVGGESVTCVSGTVKL